jgi:hypothetical protein
MPMDPLDGCASQSPTRGRASVPTRCLGSSLTLRTRVPSPPGAWDPPQRPPGLASPSPPRGGRRAPGSGQWGWCLVRPTGSKAAGRRKIMSAIFNPSSFVSNIPLRAISRSMYLCNAASHANTFPVSLKKVDVNNISNKIVWSKSWTFVMI